VEDGVGVVDIYLILSFKTTISDLRGTIEFACPVSYE